MHLIGGKFQGRLAYLELSRSRSSRREWPAVVDEPDRKGCNTGPSQREVDLGKGIRQKGMISSRTDACSDARLLQYNVTGPHFVDRGWGDSSLGAIFFIVGGASSKLCFFQEFAIRSKCTVSMCALG